MLAQGGDTGAFHCPGCGALLQSDLADQFFCEHCGSPLVGMKPTGDVSQPVAEDQEPTIRSEAAGTSYCSKEEGELPDWLAETMPADQWEQATSKQIELRPVTIPSPATDAPGRRRAMTCTVPLVILLVLGTLCLAGLIVCSALGAQTWPLSAPSERTKVIEVSAQRPWQSAGIRVRTGQVLALTYLDGTWSVWGGARGVQKQTDAAGFPGEYRSVGLPLTSAPVGALVGRIGNHDPFLVGRGVRFHTGEAGIVWLMINDQSLEDNIGSLRIEVQVSSP